MKKITMTEPMDLFYPGLDDSPYYRIPSLLKLDNGKLIAGADQRNTTEFDWGKINPVLRFKEDDGSFSDIIKVIEMDEEGTSAPPFNIDMCLVEGKKGKNPGRIYMLIDAFKSGGDYWHSEIGTGYRKVGDKNYLRILSSYGDEYLVDKTGKVFSHNMEPTELKVQMTDAMPFSHLYDIYENNEKIGNLFKDNSPYQVNMTPFLWLLYSDDGGSTWQNIIDITDQVADENMKFIGTGPGRGLELSSGRLVFPIYYSVDDKDGNSKQNTAVVYTDDGENFTRSLSVNDSDGYDSLKGEYPVNTSEAQLIERANGDVWIFLRNDSGKIRYSISKDGCQSFSSQYEVDFESESYCMLSVVYYIEDNKEYILLSNPQGPDRYNGTIKLIEIVGDDSVKTIGEYPINQTSYTYSCLEILGGNHFALLYEEQAHVDGEDRQHLKYVEFSIEEIN